MLKDKKIGLALGGGAVLGTAHIGVLKALDEFNIKISFISGTSIGSLIAAFTAFGFDWKSIKEIALSLDWMDISTISLSQYGLLSNKNIGELISEKIKNPQFENSNIPLAVITTDISNGKKVIITKGRVDNAVMASTSIPGLFAPVEINNDLLVDGGIVENVPFSPLKKFGADYIIAVDLNAGRNQKRPENIIGVLLNTFDFTIMTATKLQTEEADMLIKPDLSKYNMIETNQIDNLIDEGYKEAKKMFEKYLNI